MPDASAPRWSLVHGLRRAGRGLLALPAPLVWASIVAWMGAIWLLSSRHGSAQTSSGLYAVFANMAHAPIFGLLGLMIAAVLLRSAAGAGWPAVGLRRGASVLAGVGIYAVIDEWHQSFVPGRSSSAMDVLTDLLGAGCVLWIVAYLGRGEASELGLGVRLLAGIAACTLSAVLGV